MATPRQLSTRHCYFSIEILTDATSLTDEKIWVVYDYYRTLTDACEAAITKDFSLGSTACTVNPTYEEKKAFVDTWRELCNLMAPDILLNNLNIRHLQELLQHRAQ